MKKTFDCLKMKDEVQAGIYAEIKDMSAVEELAYFNEKSQGSALWKRLTERDKARHEGHKGQSNTIIKKCRAMSL